MHKVLVNKNHNCLAVTNVPVIKSLSEKYMLISQEWPSYGQQCSGESHLPHVLPQQRTHRWRPISGNYTDGTIYQIFFSLGYWMI